MNSDNPSANDNPEHQHRHHIRIRYNSFNYNDYYIGLIWNKSARKREIIQFISPFPLQISNLVIFFRIIDRNFPSDYKYHPIFNISCIKLSYSTTPNLGSIIAADNSLKVRINGIDRDDNIIGLNINNNKNTDYKNIKAKHGNKTCNSRNQHMCPWKGFCLRRNVVYKVEVTTLNEFKKIYTGSTANFTTRYRGGSHKFICKSRNKRFFPTTLIN